MNDKDHAPLDHMAEAIEHARYENMATARWADLREAERAARIDLMDRSLESSGIRAALRDLRERSDRSDELARLVAQRDRELGGQRADHEDRERELSNTVMKLRAQLDEAQAQIVATDERARHAERLVTMVRAALAGQSEPPRAAAVPALVQTNATDPEATHVSRAAPRNPFSRADRRDV